MPTLKEQLRKLKDSYLATLAKDNPEEFKKLESYWNNRVANDESGNITSEMIRNILSSSTKLGQTIDTNKPFEDFTLNQQEGGFGANKYQGDFLKNQFGNDETSFAKTSDNYLNIGNPALKDQIQNLGESYEEVWKKTGFEGDEDIQNLYDNAYNFDEETLEKNYKRISGLKDTDVTPLEFVQAKDKSKQLRNKVLENKAKLASSRWHMSMADFVGTSSDEEAVNAINNMKVKQKDLFNLTCDVALKKTDSEIAQDEDYYEMLKKKQADNSTWNSTYNSEYNRLIKQASENKEEFNKSLAEFKKVCEEWSPIYNVHKNSGEIDNSDAAMIKRMAEFNTNASLFGSIGAYNMLHSDFIHEVDSNENFFEKVQKVGANLYNQSVGTLYATVGALYGLGKTLANPSENIIDAIGDGRFWSNLAENCALNYFTEKGAEAMRGDTGLSNLVLGGIYGTEALEASKECNIPLSTHLGDHWYNYPFEILEQWGPTVASMIFTSGASAISSGVGRLGASTLGKMTTKGIAKNIAANQLKSASAKMLVQDAFKGVANRWRTYAIPALAGQGETCLNAYENYQDALETNLANLDTNLPKLAEQYYNTLEGREDMLSKIIAENASSMEEIGINPNSAKAIELAEDILNSINEDTGRKEELIRLYQDTEDFKQEAGRAVDMAKDAMTTDFVIESTFNGVTNAFFKYALNSPIVRDRIVRGRNALRPNRTIKKEVNNIRTELNRATGMWQATAKPITRWTELGRNVKSALGEGVEEWGQDVIGSFSQAVSGYGYSNYLYNRLEGTPATDAMDLDTWTIMSAGLMSACNTAFSKQALVDGFNGFISTMVGGAAPSNRLVSMAHGDLSGYKDYYGSFKEKNFFGKAGTVASLGGAVEWKSGFSPLFQGKQYYAKLNAENSKVAERMNLYFGADSEAKRQLDDVHAMVNATTAFKDACEKGDEKEMRDAKSELLLTGVMALNHLENEVSSRRRTGRRKGTANATYYETMMQTLQERAKLAEDIESVSPEAREQLLKEYKESTMPGLTEEIEDKTDEQILKDIGNSAKEILQLKEELKQEQKKARRRSILTGEQIDEDVIDAIAYNSIMEKKTGERYNSLKSKVDNATVRSYIEKTATTDNKRVELSKEDKSRIARFGNLEGTAGRIAQIDKAIENTKAIKNTYDEAVKKGEVLSEADKKLYNKVTSDLASLRKTRENLQKHSNNLSKLTNANDSNVDNRKSAYLTAEEILNLSDEDRAFMINNATAKYKDSKGKEHYVYSKQQRDEIDKLIDAGTKASEEIISKQREQGKSDYAEDFDYKNAVYDTGRLKQGLERYAKVRLSIMNNPEALQQFVKNAKFKKAIRAYKEAYSYLRNKNMDYRMFKEEMNKIVSSTDNEKLNAIKEMFEQDDNGNENWERWKKEVKNYENVINLLKDSALFRNINTGMQIDIQNLLLFASADNDSISTAKETLWNEEQFSKFLDFIIESNDDSYNLDSLETKEAKIESLNARFTDDYKKQLSELLDKLDAFVRSKVLLNTKINPSETTSEQSEVPQPEVLPETPATTSVPAEISSLESLLNQIIPGWKEISGLIIDKVYKDIQSENKSEQAKQFVSLLENTADNIAEGITNPTDLKVALVNYLNALEQANPSYVEYIKEIKALVENEALSVNMTGTTNVKNTNFNIGASILNNITIVDKESEVNNTISSNSISLLDNQMMYDLNGAYKKYMDDYDMLDTVLTISGVNGINSNVQGNGTPIYFIHDSGLTNSVKTEMQSKNANYREGKDTPVIVVVEEKDLPEEVQKKLKESTKHKTIDIKTTIDGKEKITHYYPIGFLPSSYADAKEAQNRGFNSTKSKFKGSKTSLSIRNLITKEQLENGTTLIESSNGQRLATRLQGQNIGVVAPHAVEGSTQSIVSHMTYSLVKENLLTKEEANAIENLFISGTLFAYKKYKDKINEADLAAVLPNNQNRNLIASKLNDMLDAVAEQYKFGTMHLADGSTQEKTYYLRINNGLEEKDYKLSINDVAKSPISINGQMMTLEEAFSRKYEFSNEDFIKALSIHPLFKHIVTETGRNETAHTTGILGEVEKQNQGKKIIGFNTILSSAFMKNVFSKVNSFNTKVNLNSLLPDNEYFNLHDLFHFANGGTLYVEMIDGKKYITIETANNETKILADLDIFTEVADSNNDEELKRRLNSTVNRPLFIIEFLKKLTFEVNEQGKITGQNKDIKWNVSDSQYNFNTTSLIFSGVMYFPYDALNYTVNTPSILDPFDVNKKPVYPEKQPQDAPHPDKSPEPVKNDGDTGRNKNVDNVESYEQRWHNAFDSIVEKSRALSNELKSESDSESGQPSGQGVTTINKLMTGESSSESVNTLATSRGTLVDSWIRSLFDLDYADVWNTIESFGNNDFKINAYLEKHFPNMNASGARQLLKIKKTLLDNGYLVCSEEINILGKLNCTVNGLPATAYTKGKTDLLLYKDGKYIIVDIKTTGNNTLENITHNASYSGQLYMYSKGFNDTYGIDIESTAILPISVQNTPTVGVGDDEIAWKIEKDANGNDKFVGTYLQSGSNVAKTTTPNVNVSSINTEKVNESNSECVSQLNNLAFSYPHIENLELKGTNNTVIVNSEENAEALKKADDKYKQRLSAINQALKESIENGEVEIKTEEGNSVSVNTNTENISVTPEAPSQPTTTQVDEFGTQRKRKIQRNKNKENTPLSDVEKAALDCVDKKCK